ncbi:hypothetical protein [Oceanobacter mangrovi]|uniref:hypothetical protein n=1 Tax=Oceanobacter mangrovi TaxID=2862510 RepID=UPI001C8E95E8|nr:hypothetical protein [Oceanobacter mangrovi]
MDISQLQLPLVLQVVTLLLVSAILVVALIRMASLQKQINQLSQHQRQQGDSNSENLDSAVNEIKDHFEINLSNLARDADDIRQNMIVNGEQTQRALELQELAFSEATTGNTRIQDVMSENYRRQHKLIESLMQGSVNAFRELTDKVRSEIHTDLEKHDAALHTMSHSAQRMSANMSAHFSEVSQDVLILKKAVATIIKSLNAQEVALSGMLQQELRPIDQQQQAQQQQLLKALDKIQLSLDMADSAALALTDIQRSQQAQRQQLLDIADTTSSTQEAADVALRNQVDMGTFERRIESLGQEMAELSVVMQPMLESVSENQGKVAAAVDLTELTEELREWSQALTDEWQKALEQQADASRRRQSELTQYIDQLQSNLSSELDALRNNQRQSNEELQRLQNLLTLLQAERTKVGQPAAPTELRLG